MSKRYNRNLIWAAFLTLACLSLAGCHGGASQASAPESMISQAPNTPQTQAKLQGQLNNPRVSPRMKQAIEHLMQQSHGSSQP